MRKINSTLLGLGSALFAVFISQPATANETITLDMTIRDFRPISEVFYEAQPGETRAERAKGGHPDFGDNLYECHGSDQKYGGNKAFEGMVKADLDGDNKPVYSGAVKFPDEIARRKDKQGKTCPVPSEASFRQWFKDTPGVNLTLKKQITLTKRSDGMYVFDSEHDQDSNNDVTRGFFPIDDEGFIKDGTEDARQGADKPRLLPYYKKICENLSNKNKPGKCTKVAHNFHFTTEIVADFYYKKNDKLTFRFRGDDDVWVFINGKLAIDIGGIHGALQKEITLDKTNARKFNLVDNSDVNTKNNKDTKKNTMRIFHAERHEVAASFKIETNINFVPHPPPFTPPFDIDLSVNFDNADHALKLTSGDWAMKESGNSTLSNGGECRGQSTDNNTESVRKADYSSAVICLKSDAGRMADAKCTQTGLKSDDEKLRCDNTRKLETALKEILKITKVWNGLKNTKKDWKALELTLLGHASCLASRPYNQALSRNRARIVNLWLDSKIANVDLKTQTRGCGEDYPLQPNDNVGNRAANRRTIGALDTTAQTCTFKKKGESVDRIEPPSPDALPAAIKKFSDYFPPVKILNKDKNCPN